MSGSTSVITRDLKINVNAINPFNPAGTPVRLRQEGVGSIEMRERSDEPCHVRVRYHSMNGSVSYAGSSGFFDCSNNQNRRQGTQRTAKKVEVARLHVARSVQVCRGSGGKVKGVELEGIDGRCLSSANPAYCPLQNRPASMFSVGHFERNNCPGSNSGSADSDWGTQSSYCGSVRTGNGNIRTPTAMVGVQLHMNDRGNRSVIIGMRAICKKVRFLQ
ncbi:hypothetical protein [Roseibium algae]|uniref:Uncharacterized protein n=1 Tax=Roseibium algae TaxID=3123038 RepID=A0ABU8TLD0_9HYPH